MRDDKADVVDERSNRDEEMGVQFDRVEERGAVVDEEADEVRVALDGEDREEGSMKHLEHQMKQFVVVCLLVV